VALVGINPEKMSIDIDEIKKFTEDSGMSYYEVNLKNIALISKVFEDMATQILKKVS
jgi:hypothetical protein